MTSLSLTNKFAFLLLLLLILFLALTVSLACGGSSGSSGPIGPVDPGDIIGSGNVVEESRPVSGYSSVDLSGIGTLSIEQTGAESLVVRAEDNLLQYIQTVVVGDELEIRTEPGVSFQTTQDIEYGLTVDDLTAAQMSGVGRIECDALSTPTFELEFSGTGSAEFTELDTDDLEVDMTGVGDVRFTGSATEQTVRISGVGDYKGRGLSSSRASVEISGSSSATVRVSNRLEVRIVGSGCVYYIGNPVIDSTITGSGCVERYSD